MRTRVQTRLHRVLNANQRHALDLLADYNRATVSNAIEATEDGLTIHSETALVLFRFGYVEPDGAAVEITKDGLRKAGRIVKETPAERRQRRSAESLAAQESGKWVPAKAGESALASEEDYWARRTWAQAHEDLQGARSNLAWNLEWLAAVREWGDEGEVKRAEKEVAVARGHVEKAQVRVDELHKQRVA